MLGYTWKTRGKIFLVNLIVIAIFGTIGYGLDYIFHKKALFIFVLIILSFPLPTIMIRRIVKKERAQKMQTPTPETEKLDSTSITDYIR